MWKRDNTIEQSYEHLILSMFFFNGTERMKKIAIINALSVFLTKLINVFNYAETNQKNIIHNLPANRSGSSPSFKSKPHITK